MQSSLPTGSCMYTRPAASQPTKHTNKQTRRVQAHLPNGKLPHETSIREENASDLLERSGILPPPHPSRRVDRAHSTARIAVSSAVGHTSDVRVRVFRYGHRSAPHVFASGANDRIRTLPAGDESAHGSMVLRLLLLVTIAHGLLAGVEPAGEDFDRVPGLLAEKVIREAGVGGGAIDGKVGELWGGGGNDRHLAYGIARPAAPEETEGATRGGGSGAGGGAGGYWGNCRGLWDLVELRGFWGRGPLSGWRRAGRHDLCVGRAGRLATSQSGSECVSREVCVGVAEGWTATGRTGFASSITTGALEPGDIA